MSSGWFWPRRCGSSGRGGVVEVEARPQVGYLLVQCLSVYVSKRRFHDNLLTRLNLMEVAPEKRMKTQKRGERSDGREEQNFFGSRSVQCAGLLGEVS